MNPLTPLAPFQTTPVAPVPSLPGAPPPMQPISINPPATQSAQAAAPAWQQPVQQSFQQAYQLFDPLASGLATGAIPIAPHAGYATSGGGGGYSQDIPDTGGGYDTGNGYIKEGSPFSQYNNGLDQGPQTASPGQYADSTPAYATGIPFTDRYVASLPQVPGSSGGVTPSDPTRGVIPSPSDFGTPATKNTEPQFYGSGVDRREYTPDLSGGLE